MNHTVTYGKAIAADLFAFIVDSVFVRCVCEQAALVAKGVSLLSYDSDDAHLPQAVRHLLCEPPWARNSVGEISGGERFGKRRRNDREEVGRMMETDPVDHLD